MHVKYNQGRSPVHLLKGLTALEQLGAKMVEHYRYALAFLAEAAETGPAAPNSEQMIDTPRAPMCAIGPDMGLPEPPLTDAAQSTLPAAHRLDLQVELDAEPGCRPH
eukprot:SAG31_NODE_10346_length_1151_cov_0.857414_1_plen_107_part_10